MRRILPLSLFVLLSGAIASAQVNAQKSVIRGWLSDEDCAGGRAKAGLYTGTNPECAKKCVHDGKKIVLIDSDHKRLLVISNQAPAVANVGDYVEISGDLDDQARTLHIDSLKLLEKGRAMCGVPPKKSAT
jgi:hypothetical protein